MFEGKRIAVVVPAYREEARIRATLASIPSFVDDVVVVDDASPDATAALARLDPRSVHVVVHTRNRGVGAAIATGLCEAIQRGADIVAIMAGDGQMDPADLPRLLFPIARARADFVKGDRFAHPDIARSMPIARYLAGRMLARLTQLACGLPELSDSQTGYVAMSRALVASLDLGALWPRYGYPNDLLAMLAARSARIESVVVRPIYRGEASGLRPWHLTVVGYVIARAASRRAFGRLDQSDAFSFFPSVRARARSSARSDSAFFTSSSPSSAARRTGRSGPHTSGRSDASTQYLPPVE